MCIVHFDHDVEAILRAGVGTQTGYKVVRSDGGAQYARYTYKPGLHVALPGVGGAFARSDSYSVGIHVWLHESSARDEQRVMYRAGGRGFTNGEVVAVQYEPADIMYVGKDAGRLTVVVRAITISPEAWQEAGF